MFNTQFAPVHFGPSVNDTGHVNAVPAPSRTKGTHPGIIPIRAVPEKKGVSADTLVFAVDVQRNAIESIRGRPGRVGETEIALLGLFGGRPDVVVRLVLGVEIRRIADFGPTRVGAVKAADVQTFGRIITELLNLLHKLHDLAGFVENGKQALFAGFGDHEVQALGLVEFTAFFLRQFVVFGRAFYSLSVFLRARQRELRASPRPGLVDRAYVVFKERAGLLRGSHGISNVEALLVQIFVVQIVDLIQDVKTLLLGPSENVMVRNVNIDVLTTPRALLTSKYH